MRVILLCTSVRHKAREPLDLPTSNMEFKFNYYQDRAPIEIKVTRSKVTITLQKAVLSCHVNCILSGSAFRPGLKVGKSAEDASKRMYIKSQVHNYSCYFQ